VLNGRVGIQVEAPVRKRVGGDVHDAHEQWRVHGGREYRWWWTGRRASSPETVSKEAGGGRVERAQRAL